MSTASVNLLVILLVCLILLSAFFASAETGLMSLNRYRLRHQARKGLPSAKRVVQLLERPDRLLGVILIGSTFANVLASAVATILAVRFLGNVGIAISTFIFTLTLLIFGEITPKILAALYPERISYNASLPLKYLLKIFYPLVWITSEIANSFLRLFRIKKEHGNKMDLLTHDELRSVVFDAVGKSSTRYHEMLLGILDLSQATVEDIMVPRNEILGINIEDEWSEILKQLNTSIHTRIPIYRGSIDNVMGILHLRKLVNIFADMQADKQKLLKAADEAYFVPEGTPLNKQLLNFQKQKMRIGLVVDEYGDILGLLTLEDILEEVIGQFTTDISNGKDILPQKDGSYLVNGGVNLRELNRQLGWELPTQGPKTLSGLIVEYLETIPTTGICLRIAGYPIEVLAVEANTIKTALIRPLRRI